MRVDGFGVGASPHTPGNTSIRMKVKDMARFRGRVEDVFTVDTGTALFLTEVEGMPREGLLVRLGDRVRSVLTVGRNTTDGQPVSFRDCLTGKPVSGYGHVLVDERAVVVECVFGER